MDFSFLLNVDLLTFLLAFIVFGVWELIKIRKKDVDARIITTINGAIAVIFAILVAAFGLETDVFAVMVKAGAVFAAGSFYDLLKAYGILKK
jgi:uncharacterized Tic20 family protein